jgi:predicted peptidase
VISGAERFQVRELPPGDWPALAPAYLRYLPPDYEPSGRPLPLVLFLHGAGERGDDPFLPAVYGPPKQIMEGRDLPFLLVAPQCPREQRWSPRSLSGTWALAVAQPHRFSAIAPVCGFGDPSGVAPIAHLPAWVFHGARDDVVPLSRSEEMVKALERAGGNVRLTVYPEVGHDSWTPAYAEPGLYPWLLEQRRR